MAEEVAASILHLSREKEEGYEYVRYYVRGGSDSSSPSHGSEILFFLLLCIQRRWGRRRRGRDALSKMMSMFS